MPASRRVQAERPVILLIENEEADIFLFRRALSHSNFTGTLRIVGSVSEAREYLLGSGQFRDPDYYPCPDLIVSDMSLPGATGNAFLEWLRQDSKCAHIPFVFLSGSFQPIDKLRADELGADSFFAKTGDMNVMRERVEQMLKFLPPAKPGANPKTSPPENKSGNTSGT
jgi:CheY-like chemotaxis protein